MNEKLDQVNAYLEEQVSLKQETLSGKDQGKRQSLFAILFYLFIWFKIA